MKREERMVDNILGTIFSQHLISVHLSQWVLLLLTLEREREREVLILKQ